MVESARIKVFDPTKKERIGKSIVRMDMGSTANDCPILFSLY